MRLVLLALVALMGPATAALAAGTGAWTMKFSFIQGAPELHGQYVGTSTYTVATTPQKIFFNDGFAFDGSVFQSIVLPAGGGKACKVYHSNQGSPGKARDVTSCVTLSVAAGGEMDFVATIAAHPDDILCSDGWSLQPAADCFTERASVAFHPASGSCSAALRSYAAMSWTQFHQQVHRALVQVKSASCTILG